MQRGQCSCLNRPSWYHLTWQVYHSIYPRPEFYTSSRTQGGIHWGTSDATNRQNALKSSSSLITSALLPFYSVNIWWSPTSRRPTLCPLAYTRSILKWTVSLVRTTQENYEPSHINVRVVLCVFTYFCRNQINEFSRVYITSFLNKILFFLLIHINI